MKKFIALCLLLLSHSAQSLTLKNCTGKEIKLTLRQLKFYQNEEELIADGFEPIMPLFNKDGSVNEEAKSPSVTSSASTLSRSSSSSSNKGSQNNLLSPSSPTYYKQYTGFPTAKSIYITIDLTANEERPINSTHICEIQIDGDSLNAKDRDKTSNLIIKGGYYYIMNSSDVPPKDLEKNEDNDKIIRLPNFVLIKRGCCSCTIL